MLVDRVKTGDPAAYEPIVLRFQDMAVGYSYSILGDLPLAEDAAQEAFINAYFDLPNLCEPAAFPGWFRRIVFKQADRLRRSRRSAMSLDELPEVTATRPGPVEVFEKQEAQDKIFMTINALPAAQREIVTLFYISEYSQKEISAFLDLPLSTVKMRLYHARKKLKTKMVTLIEDYLPQQRPSKDNRFKEKIMSYPVEVKDAANLKIVSISRRLYVKDLEDFIVNSFDQLRRYVEAHGEQVAGAPMNIYHGGVTETHDGPVEACLPMTGAIEANEAIGVRELSPTRVAYTTLTHKQAIFPGILKAYDAVCDWITENGYQMTEPPREIYLGTPPKSENPNEPFIEIAWPFH